MTPSICRRCFATALGFALLTDAPLLSQAWNLPARGAVFYKRDRSQAPGGRMSGFGEVEMPPILLAGELDRSRKFVALSPADLRDLPAWLAFDMRLKGSFKRRVHTIHGATDIAIQGKASATDSDGVQTIEATLTPTGAGASGDQGAEARVSGTITIRRTIDSKAGLVGSFTSEFRAKIRGGNAGGRGRPGRGGRGRGPGGGRDRGGAEGSAGDGSVTLKDSWQLDRVEQNREPVFETRVAEAVRLGATYVKKLLENGELGGGGGPPGVDVEAGTLALCLLTLLKADIDRRDEVIRKGFERLRRRKLEDTYSLAVALMAMEALYAPSGERELLIEGRIKEPMERKVPPQDMAIMKEWTQQLLKNYDVSQKRAYLLRFNYVSSVPRYDNSNTQYALLGLYSAHLCKVPISPTVWFANAQHWLGDQTEEAGVKIRFSTTSLKDYAKVLASQKAARQNPETTSANSNSRRTVRSARVATAAGWPYVKRTAGGTRGGGGPRGGGRGGGRRGGMPEMARAMPNTASMCTAGLTGVTICQAVLHRQKKGRGVNSKLRKAKRNGLAWLLHEFSVRVNKNKGQHLHYYLYGLERACEINQIALLGDRDWYFEGANILVETQVKSNRAGPGERRGRDGGGGGGMRRGMGRGRGGMAGGQAGAFQGARLPQTCMAILFLKQSAPPMPAITGRR